MKLNTISSSAINRQKDEQNHQSDLFEDDDDVDAAKNDLKETKSLDLVKERIQEVIHVLADFRNRADEGRNRKDYLEVSFFHFKNVTKLILKSHFLFDSGA